MALEMCKGLTYGPIKASIGRLSSCQKRGRGELPDVYQYETIPEALRIQIIHIIRDAFGDLHDLLSSISIAPSEAANPL